MTKANFTTQIFSMLQKQTLFETDFMSPGIRRSHFFTIFLVYVSWSKVLKWQSLFLMNFTFLIFYLFIYCIFLGNSEGKKITRIS